VLAHWDEIEGGSGEVGHLGGRWRRLGDAAGSKTIGANRIDIYPGKWSTPLHVQTAEEEIFYVLRGSGICLQDDAAYEVRPGDCLVFLAGGPAHTLKAGDDGLDVIAFGTRVPIEAAYLPRAGVAWIWHKWTEVGGGGHPWDREVEAGEPEVPELGERPENVVNVEDVEAEPESDGSWKRLGRAAGAEQSGLNWGRLAPNEEDDNEHCHSAEEELFVILEGSGRLELQPSNPPGAAVETHEVRRGHVISRPARTRVAHSFVAGDEGLTLLIYGTREPNDIAFYPRSRKIFFRGVGLMTRLDHLDYWEGEEEPPEEP
jgi:uncharacterized cupin superfamily protein